MAAPGRAADCGLLPEPFDRVVSDVVMPGTSGRDMVERVLEVWPEVPVLFTSGYPGDIVLDHAISGEQTALLGKPFTGRELPRTVRATLDGAVSPDPQIFGSPPG